MSAIYFLCFVCFVILAPSLYLFRLFYGLLSPIFSSCFSFSSLSLRPHLRLPRMSLVPHIIKRLLCSFLCLPPSFCSLLSQSLSPAVLPLWVCTLWSDCWPAPLPFVCVFFILLSSFCVCNKLVGKNISPFCRSAFSLVSYTSSYRVRPSPSRFFGDSFSHFSHPDELSCLSLVFLFFPSHLVFPCLSVFCLSFRLRLHQMLQQYVFCASLHCRMLLGGAS